MTSRRISCCGLVCLLLFVPGAIGAFTSNSGTDLEAMGLTTEPVKFGRFTKTVPASGDIRTEDPSIVFNDCRWHEQRIIELVPEGTWVEKGDIVCLLDASELQEKLNERKISLIRAKSALSGASISGSLQDLTNSRRLGTRQYNLAVADSRLRAFEQAEAATELDRLGGDVRLSEESHQIIREEFNATRSFTALGYQNTATLMSADARRSRAKTVLNSTEGQLHLAERFQQPRTLLQLKLDADSAKQELDRTALQNCLSVKVTELQTLEKQRALATVETHVDYLSRALDACTMRAQKSGEVVYCHQRDQGRFIEAGASVYYTQDLIRIADRSRLIVSAHVSDRQVHELRENLPVEFQVQSNPNQIFFGTLRWIAPMASAPQWFQPYDRQQDVEISVHPDQDGFSTLPLGTTVVARIIVDDRSDVLQVPVRAIFNLYGTYAVLVQGSTGMVAHEVRLGANNETWVEVTNGLVPDDVIVIGNQQPLQKLAESLKTGLVQCL